MKKISLSSERSLTAAVIFLLINLPISIPPQAEGGTIFLYSEPRPGLFGGEGATSLPENFNEALHQIPIGWSLDAVQKNGGIYPISTVTLTLDHAYGGSELTNLPNFMCVGNYEAETAEDMTDIRTKFSGYPDWNLMSAPSHTSETTHSYDVGDIHVVVINEHWDAPLHK